MVSAQKRELTLPALTRSERLVLADLQLFQNSSQKAVLSSRKLAALTGLSPRGVRKAIDVLNERQLIRTYIGSRVQPSEHTVICQVPVRSAGGDGPRGRS